MKNSLLIKKMLMKSGVMSFLRRFDSHGRLAVLRYHSIVEPGDNYYASPSICITPGEFENHVRFFSKYFKVISLDTVWHCLANNRQFPENAVVFTFDDGYRDNFRAYEVLRRFGVSGTFYIAAGCMDHKEPLWLFEVIYLIQETAAHVIRFDLPWAGLEFILDTDENRQGAVRKLTEFIKSNTLETREEIRRQLHDQTRDVADFHEKSAGVMLTWEQVREMSDNGMTIGGHTMTHLNLPNAGYGDAFHEIKECKRVIEERTGVEARHFSYPNGGNYDYYNDSIVGMVRDAGYLTSTTSNNGLVEPGSNRLELNRIRVTRELSEILYQIDCEPVIDRLTGIGR